MQEGPRRTPAGRVSFPCTVVGSIFALGDVAGARAALVPGAGKKGGGSGSGRTKLLALQREREGVALLLRAAPVVAVAAVAAGVSPRR